MQILGQVGVLVHLAWRKISHNATSEKITAYLSACMYLLIISNLQLPNAHAHVSHVLPVQQYTDIKSGHPDIEIIATIVTGLIVISVILVQSFQKNRRALNSC